MNSHTSSQDRIDKNSHTSSQDRIDDANKNSHTSSQERVDDEISSSSVLNDLHVSLSELVKLDTLCITCLVFEF